MIGLLVVAVAVAWIWCCRWIARAVSARAAPRWRTAVAWLGLAILLPLPLIDEVVGAVQLFPLCHAGEELKVDPARIRGQRVELEVGRPEPVRGLALPVTSHRFSYRSVTDGVELATTRRYSADGGLLMRLVGGGATLPPLLPVTSQGYTCSGPGVREMAQRYEFTLVEDGGRKK